MIVENLSVPFDRRVWNEARTLRDAGHTVFVICPKGGPNEAAHEVLEGVEIWRHPLPVEAVGRSAYVLEYGAALWFEFILAFNILFRRGFDVIHACNPPDLIFIVAAVFKGLFGKKFVFDHHDLCPELYEAKFGSRGTGWKLLAALERMTFALADASIATNESYREIAISRGKMPRDKVFVVRSGPRLEEMTMGRRREELRRGARHVIGYVGVIGEQEGLDLLLEAIAHIVHARGREGVHAVIVGDGGALPAAKALATKLNLDAHVTFTGRVPRQELMDTLASADVCVNCDRVNQLNDKSTMNKIVEYMAVGRPIVQFDVTEGRRSALDASLYAKPNDPIDFAEQIVSLLDDPAKAEAMGAFGRKRFAEALHWGLQTAPLLETYAAAFQPKRAPVRRISQVAQPTE